jgi:predicted amidohydrolase YtcJ
MHEADLILINGHVITMDSHFPYADAVAVLGNRIVGVGDSVRMAEFKGEKTQVIDLAGKTLLPGFNDSHLHMLSFGLGLLNVRLQGAASIDEMVQRVAKKAGETPKGEWITGAGWDQNLYTEKRYPNRHDLDRVAPLHPVALRHVSGHALLVNSMALELAGIHGDTVAPEGGHIDLDADGEPTGVLRETASSLVSHFYYPVSREVAKQALELAMKKAVAEGLTSVSDNSTAGVAGGFPVYFEILNELWEEGLPAVRSAQYISDEEIDHVIQAGWRTGEGNDRVNVGGIKFFCDGSFMAQTAAMREPFTDDPGNTGLFMQSQEVLKSEVLKAHRNDLQVAIHAIGDAGIDKALDAIENALTIVPKENHRHRIVHFEILTEDILVRAKRLGVVADIQPKFVSSQGGWVEERVGKERARLTFPWKTVLAKGIPCGGSSDCPVEPLEPLWGIHAAVNRQVDSIPGMKFMPEEALSVVDALDLFTRGSAFTTFEESQKGMIRAGMLADLVVLGENPMTCEPESIRDIPVEMTFVDGVIMYPRG